MADDVNNSNKPINGANIAQDGADSLTRGFNRTVNRDTVESKHIRQQGIAARETERFFAAEHRSNQINGAPISDLLVSAQDLGMAKQNRIDISNKYQEQRARNTLAATNTLESGTATFLGHSNTRSRISTMLNSTDVMGAAARNTGSGMPGYFAQERALNQATMERGAYASQMQSAAAAGNTRLYGELAGKLGGAEGNMALAEKSMNSLKKAGYDPEAQMNTSEKYLKAARRDEITENARNNAGSAGFTQKDIANETSTLIASLKSLSDAFQKGEKTIEEFATKSNEITEGLEDLKAKGAGIGNNGNSIGWGDIGKVGELAGNAIAHTARVKTDINVNNRREHMSQKAAFANTANRMYGRAESAIMDGDMDALMELTGGGTAAAGREGAYAGDYTNRMNVAIQTGEGLAGIGRTTQAAVGGGKAAGVPGAIAAGGAQGIIETGNAANRYDKHARGTVGGAAALGNWGARLEVDEATRKMQSKMMQGAYNQGMGSYNAVAGLGDSAGMQAQLLDASSGGMLEQLKGVGISGTQANQLASQMGAAGTVSASDSMDIIKSAGDAKRKGVMSQGQYVGMASQLMGAGGGVSDLSDQISRGFDNSKLAGDMVAGTLQISNNLTNMGIGAVSSSGEMLARTSQDLMALGMNENLATGAALTSSQNLNNSFGSTKMSLGSIMEYSNINSMFGGKGSNAQNMAVAKMTSEDLGVLQAGSTAKAGKEGDYARKQASLLLDRKGLTDLMGTGPNGQVSIAMLDQVRRSKVGKTVIDVGMWEGGVNPNSMMQDGEFSQRQKAAADLGGFHYTQFQNAANGKYTAEMNKTGKNTVISGAVADEARAGMELKLLTDAIESSGLKDLGTIFKGLEETMQDLQEKVSASEIQKLATDAANRMVTAVDNFHTHVTKFGEIFGSMQAANEKAMGTLDSPTGAQGAAAKAAQKRVNDHIMGRNRAPGQGYR